MAAHLGQPYAKNETSGASKDALPPTRRDFVHCVVCTRGCICICFGAGRATQRRPAPNPTGLRTLRCVYAWLHMHMLRGRTRHAKTPCPRTLRCVYAWLHMHMLRGRTRHAKTPCPRTLRCVYGLVLGHFGPYFPRSILFRPIGDAQTPSGGNPAQSFSHNRTLSFRPFRAIFTPTRSVFLTRLVRVFAPLNRVFNPLSPCFGPAQSCF
jgi:hypothetical protein